jgi:hypothetical protein
LLQKLELYHLDGISLVTARIETMRIDKLKPSLPSSLVKMDFVLPERGFWFLCFKDGIVIPRLPSPSSGDLL